MASAEQATPPTAAAGQAAAGRKPASDRPETKTPEEYVRWTAETDPKTALELALAENERIRARAERDTDVRITPEGFECTTLNGLWRLATIYSKSGLVPDHFHHNPEACFVGLQAAVRCRVDGFAFLQHCYIVHGRPGIEGKLAIAMLHASRRTAGPLRYEFTGSGKGLACTCHAVDRETGEVLSATVSWETVEAEGWCVDKPTRSGGVQRSKWNTMPEQMFRYRSATFLIRAYYPDVLMGLSLREELDELGPPVRESPVDNRQPATVAGPVNASAFAPREPATENRKPKTENQASAGSADGGEPRGFEGAHAASVGVTADTGARAGSAASPPSAAIAEHATRPGLEITAPAGSLLGDMQRRKAELAGGLFPSEETAAATAPTRRGRKGERYYGQGG